MKPDIRLFLTGFVHKVIHENSVYEFRNWAEYNFSLKQRGSLSIWFDPGMTWETGAMPESW